MSSRALFVVAVLVVVCCCCRGNVEVNVGKPSQSALGSETAYLDELVSALKREAPSLVPLAGPAGDQVFGTNEHVLDRIKTVMRRYGSNTMESNGSGCTELSYELRGAQNPRFTATVAWVDTASDCRTRLVPLPEASSGTYRYIVRIMVGKA